MPERRCCEGAGGRTGGSLPVPQRAELDFPLAGGDPLVLIKRIYADRPRAFGILLAHSRMVAAKAVRIARRLTDLAPDVDFIREAALLHDIGIRYTRAPGIGCNGCRPYLCHGYLGRELLERLGWPRHALVCERHVGVGIFREDILSRRLPLPPRDMVPLSLEEKIVCYADKFFSKDGTGSAQEKPLETVIQTVSAYGPEQVTRFRRWMRRFEGR